MTVKGLRSILILCALRQETLIVIRNVPSASLSLKMQGERKICHLPERGRLVLGISLDQEPLGTASDWNRLIYSAPRLFIFKPGAWGGGGGRRVGAHLDPV